jgi:serine/threonine-protein kinase ATR
MFLKTYMLGLISDINDMLQDVQGKKSVNMKRKILRSLGALVQQIGPMISHVSPQVCHIAIQRVKTVLIFL